MDLLDHMHLVSWIKSLGRAAEAEAVCRGFHGEFSQEMDSDEGGRQDWAEGKVDPQDFT